MSLTPMRLLFVSFSILPLMSFATEISKVRYDTKSDKTRIVFEAITDQPALIDRTEKLITLSFGDRLSVTTPAFDRVKSGIIRSVKHRGDQVEISLTKDLAIDAFTLPPRDGYPTRVVIDILNQANATIATDPEKQSITQAKESIGSAVKQPESIVKRESIELPSKANSPLSDLSVVSQRLQTELMDNRITLEEAINETREIRKQLKNSPNSSITSADIDLLDAELFALDELKNSLSSIETQVEESRQDLKTLDDSQLDMALQKANVLTVMLEKLAFSESERKEFLEGLSKISNLKKQEAAEQNRELLKELQSNREEAVSKSVELIELSKSTVAEIAYIQQQFSQQVQEKLAELNRQQVALNDAEADLLMRSADIELKEKDIAQQVSALEARKAELDQREKQLNQTKILVKKPLTGSSSTLTSEEQSVVSAYEKLDILKQLAIKAPDSTLYSQRAITIERALKAGTINEQQASKILDAQIRLVQGQ